MRWRSPSGAAGRVRARIGVLAAGGIENARLLLLAGPTPSRAPGNGSGWLGAGFMEHPRDESLAITAPSAALLDAWRFFTLNASPGNAWGRLALSPDLLASERLCNASVTLIPQLPAGRRGLLFRVLQRARPARPTAFRLIINLEQVPDRANAVRLSNRTDALGLRQAEVHWRWGQADEASRQRVLRLVAGAFESARLGHVDRVEQPVPDPNAHHHAGTTRLSVDPESGVADADGRVHGMSNLYVTGNSVFPTVGFANPTLTIVALALRLAHHLGAPAGAARTQTQP